MPRLLRFAVFVFLMLNTRIAFAACHAVSPSGSGSNSGADWNNAYAGIPATLIRGDVYYLADGSYGTYTFSTPTSGTATVEIRKAQSYDNCTSTGWNTATMGSSQAVFSGTTPFTVATSYVTVNGNGQQTTPGCGGIPSAYNAAGSAGTTPTDCGIRAVTTDTSSDIVFRLNSGATNVTEKYVELVGTGINSADSNALTAEFGGNGGFVADHIFGRNAACMYFSALAFQHTVENSYFWWIQSSPNNCHPEYNLMANGGSNTSSTPINEFNNIYRDMSGTSTFASVSSGNIWINIWDNVFMCSSTGCNGTGNDDGIMWCGNSTNCVVNFYQNTLVNLTGGNDNGLVTNASSSGSLSGNAKNNLIYNTVNSTMISSGIAQSNNTWINSAGVSGTNNVIITSGASIPFVDVANGDFTLVADSANYDNRIALTGVYNTDAAGNTFTTDRGAYQFAGTQAPAPQPPSGLTATVQ